VALNISSFRHLDVFSAISRGPACDRMFRSSGTSAQGRSRSGFSTTGLAAYRDAIVSGFEAVLRQRGFQGKRGISLIPSTAMWPESSLAAMLEWIAGSMPGERLEIPDEAPLKESSRSRFFNDFRRKIDSANGPVWIFGTTFHYLPLLEAGALPALPEGSIVFYTGGTKGRVRDIGETSFVSWLAGTFGIPVESVISEYGMSELASAAYTVPGAGRRLKFQAGVMPFVVTRILPAVLPSMLQGRPQGTGLLGVFDLNRIDIPAPIITEDVVNLSESGEFQLLGRANTAPLKGCSLLAEPQAPQIQEMSQDARTQQPVYPQGQRLATIPRNAIPSIIVDFSSSQAAQVALTAAMGSQRAATLALEDLAASASSVASGRDCWDTCVNESGILATGARLLIIPPNTHPVALAYPLAVALGAGRQVSVKLTRHQIQGDSFSRLLMRRLEAAGARIDLVPPGFRMAQPHQWNAVLAFGDDATIAAIKNSAGEKTLVAGHGETISVSLVPLDGLAQHLPAIIRDTFSMMQRGCMSSRMLGVMLPESCDREAWRYDRLADLLSHELAAQWWKTWGEAVSPVDAAGIILRGLDASAEPDIALRFPGHGLPAVQASPDGRPATFGPVLSICPVGHGTSPAEILLDWQRRWPQIRLATLPAEMVPLRPLLNGIEIRALGSANRPPWNGLHFGEPLFRPS